MSDQTFYRETMTAFYEADHVDIASDLFQAPAVEVVEERWIVPLETMQIVPSVSHLASRPGASLVRQHKEIMRLAAKGGFPITFVGYGEVFDEVRIYKGQGNDWLLVNRKKDPVREYYDGRFPVPPEVQGELNSMLESGLDYHELFVGHELPPESFETGDTVPVEVIAGSPPPSVFAESERLASRTTKLIHVVTRGIIQLGQVSVAALASATSVLALDPILFGVITDKKWQVDNRQMGLFYALVSWKWGSEEE